MPLDSELNLCFFQSVDLSQKILVIHFSLGTEFRICVRKVIIFVITIDFKYAVADLVSQIF